VNVSVHSAIAEIGREVWDKAAAPFGNPFTRYDFLQILEESGCVSAQAGWHTSKRAAARKKRYNFSDPAGYIMTLLAKVAVILALEPAYQKRAVGLVRQVTLENRYDRPHSSPRNFQGTTNAPARNGTPGH